MTVIDSISGKEFELTPIIMSLYSLSIIFSFNKVWMVQILEVINVLFTSQHRSYWIENTNFIIQRNIRVLKLFTCLKQTVC